MSNRHYDSCYIHSNLIPYEKPQLLQQDKHKRGPTTRNKHFYSNLANAEKNKKKCASSMWTIHTKNMYEFRIDKIGKPLQMIYND